MCGAGGAGAPEARPAGRPHLHLRVIRDDGDALTAEVLEGRAGAHRSLVYVEGRGPFAIVATLVRQDLGARIFLRLRAWSPSLEWSA